MDDVLECLEDGDDPEDQCLGEVAYRSTGHGRAFPRCERHWDERLKREEKIIDKYNPFGSFPPLGFDLGDAGERWEEDY